MKKTAFTMSDVLITIGIIGIVAAMTLPGVIEGYKKKQTEVHLQKVYSILSQAFEQSQVKNGEYSSWSDGLSLGAKEYFKIYWEPYFNKVIYCDTYEQCGYSKQSPWLCNNGKGYEYSVTVSDLRAPFILPDGTYVSLSVGAGDLGVEGGVYSEQIVLVDLNAGGAPNRLGMDLFVFQTTDKGLIKPVGYDKENDYINNECAQTGRTCAELIVRSGWKIVKNYPWR